MTDHTFAICAYKESPYLQECIESLMAQQGQSKIIMCTSTPNDHISSLAQRFAIPLFINDQKPGIASDWNFALERAETPYITIAHQDDIYLPEYSTHMKEAIRKMRKPLLYFTNYGELRDGREVTDSKLLAVKRKLLAPLKDGRRSAFKSTRRRALSLGSAICCPSVTLAMEHLPKPVFAEGMKSNLDWQAWAQIANLDGDFYYDSKILMLHRIHAESETSALIVDDTRTAEDLEMLRLFWPAPIARLINRFYQNGQKSNALDSATAENPLDSKTKEAR